MFLLIFTPRNRAFSVFALVIRVLSRFSSRFSRSSRNVLISSRMDLTSEYFPHTPISQSSAYLTYLMVGPKLGLLITDFVFLLREIRPLISFLISVILEESVMVLIFSYLLLIFKVRELYSGFLMYGFF